ncbi:MAG: hypothetical protein IKT40_04605 [Bacilli bacterium]|nr:hypothetical protein [Bacilli bacterium]
MVSRKLNETVKQMYTAGLADELFVMEAVEKTLGGKCKKSERNEDMFDHIDFWWDSPRKGRIGVDVKGIKKHNRKDKIVDDSIHWIEMKNVRGNKGWVYGKAEYIAFRTLTKILFVKLTDLQKFSEEKINGKEVVNKNPSEFYVPYQRWQRQDLVFKCPTSDLEQLAEFSIEY